MIKKQIVLILIFFICGTASARNASYSELIDKLSHAVQTMATGDVADGFGELEGIGKNPKSPKERAADLDNIRGKLTEIKSNTGASKKIDRISLVFVGDSYLRVRFLDRRENGGIIWTFFCARTEDDWDWFKFELAGNTDLGQLMQDTLDSADYTKEPPKEP